MAPVKRPRAEPDSQSEPGSAAPASKRARAVSSRVDTGLRAAASAAVRPVQPRERPPLKRPPMPPVQPGQDRPATAPTQAAAAPKVNTHDRPAAVTSEQLEAWRAARRQKLAERILRGRQGGSATAAAACLGMDGERKRGAAPSRPRTVPSRLMQPRPGAAATGGATGGAPGSAGPAAKRQKTGDGTSASASAPRPSTAPAARPSLAPTTTAFGGIRLNKAAERRLTLIQARRQQAERDAARRTTLAAPTAAAPRPRPAAPVVPRRTTLAGSSATSAAAACRRPTVRRSPRSPAGAAPRVTAVKTGLSRARLLALSKPKQPATKRPSPQHAARVVKPVQRRATAAPSVGGSLAPPAGLPNTMRRSLSAMHRSRSNTDRSVAVHRAPAAVPEDETDTAATVAVPSATATPKPKPSATPGRRPLQSMTPGRAIQSTPGRPLATPGRAMQSTPGRPLITPGRAMQSSSKPRLPSIQTLQERLEQWLAKRGKKLSSFKHLHCFAGDELQVAPSQPQAKRLSLSAKARRSAAARVQLEPGSPPLRATPAARSAKASPSTPVTTAAPADRTFSAEKMTPPSADVAATGEERMDNALSDLRQLQELGLPSDQVVSWLERLSRDPAAAGRARYWLCRAAAAESAGQLDTVLQCFRQASHAQAEPVAELITGLEQFVRRAASGDAENAPPPPTDDATDSPVAPSSGRRRAQARTPRRPLLDRSNVFHSSVIKYALTDDETVLKKLAAMRLGGGGETAPGVDILSVITPVRRSTRKSVKAPANPHLALFDSVEAISESLRRSALFRKNSALISP